ncbi:MAG: sortase [Actinomycetota bacterium]
MIDVIEAERADDDRPPARRRTGVLIAAAAIAAIGGALAAPTILGENSGLDLVRSVETTPDTTPSGPPATLPTEPDAASADAPTSTVATTFVEVAGTVSGSALVIEVDGAADGDALAPARRQQRPEVPTGVDASGAQGSITDSGAEGDAPAAGGATTTTPSNGSATTATEPAADDADAATGPRTTQVAAPTATGAATAVTTTAPETESAPTSAPTSAPATSIVPDEVADAAGGASEGAGADVAPTSRPPEASLIGSIAFPSLGLDFPLREGIQQSTIDLGPTHWPGTAMPGQVGNVVIAGHRTSHGGPFRHLNELAVGDVVSFEQGDGPVDYVVVGSEIVGPDALWIVDPTETPTATLFSCHPLGSTAQRIVIHLELAE